MTAPEAERELILPAIPSAITDEEARMLADLSRGKVVLEMGAWFGFSTVVIASVAERVISVDWHQGDNDAGHMDTWDLWNANLARYGVGERVTAVRERFEDALPRLEADGVLVDGCFLDAQHDEEAVERDVGLALPLLRPGGWLGFHDYGRCAATGHPGFGVTEVADRFGIKGRAGYFAWGFTPARLLAPRSILGSMRRLAPALAVLALTACTSTVPPAAFTPTPAAPAQVTARVPAPSAPLPPRSGLKRVHDPGQVTGTLTGPCHARDSGLLPDVHCTPGSVDPAVTQADIHATICVPGYTKTVRPPQSQTAAFKFDVAYPAYGIPRAEHTELDHLVSLELGGSNDASNLWPETPPTPNPKDSTESLLHSAVCSGKVTLAAAQRAIARNWMTAESTLGL